MPFTPILSDLHYTFGGDEITHTIVKGCIAVRFYPYEATTVPYFHINSVSEPKIYVVEGMTVDNDDGQIEKLVLGASGTATLNVKQIGGSIGRAIRVFA